jgi:hypothetical protein
MTTTTPTIPTRPHLDEFFDKVDPTRGRVIFAIDATASREHCWDTAAGLTNKMFGEIDGLDVQLVYFRGHDTCVASRWLSDAHALSRVMSGVMCRSGLTQIRRILNHARKQHAEKKVDAVILIGDAVEEKPEQLYSEAGKLRVPVFTFLEGDDDEHAAEIFKQIAHITGGAFCKFDTGAAARLGDLLKAVSAFAAGGVKALANQNTDAARLLLGQLSK